MENKNNINEQEELNSIAPTLFSLKKENNFSVPQNYFNEFPLKVKTRIDEESSNTFSFSSLFNYKIATAIGTCVVILLAGAYFLKPTTNIELQELTAAEIQASLEYEGYHNMDDEMLAEMYYTEETSEESFFTDELSEEDIIDYLIDENVDESQLYYEL